MVTKVSCFLRFTSANLWTASSVESYHLTDYTGQEMVVILQFNEKQNVTV